MITVELKLLVCYFALPYSRQDDTDGQESSLKIY